jgi:endonuclease/exonuclease/phosphatase family metal-dependent hydrolase
MQDMVKHTVHNMVKDTVQTSLQVGLYNVMLATPSLVRQIGQEHRVALIPPLWDSGSSDADLWVLCEVGSQTHYDYLVRAAAQRGYVYHTKPLHEELTLQGGVVVVSRLPFLEERNHVFSRSAGFDALSAKGVLWVRMEKAGVRFHVFAMHMQSGNDSKVVSIQVAQMQEIEAFIHECSLSPDEPYIIVGDLNVDWTSQSSFISLLCHTWHVQKPLRHIDSAPYPFDASNNTLVGLDHIDLHTSPEYPQGCAAEFWAQGRCVCCSSQWLDYILCADDTHRNYTIRSSGMRVIPYRTELYRIPMTGAPSGYVWTRDISDHYPMVAIVSMRTSQARTWEPCAGRVKDSAPHAPRLSTQRLSWGSATTHTEFMIVVIFTATVVLCFLCMVVYVTLHSTVWQRDQTENNGRRAKPSPRNAFGFGWHTT